MNYLPKEIWQYTVMDYLDSDDQIKIIKLKQNLHQTDFYGRDVKNNDLIKILAENIELSSEFDKSIEIKFKHNHDKIFLKSDKEQIGRAFFNLIKNSIESIQQKSEKTPNFNKKISIEILYNNEHIKFTIIDNGIGFNQNKNIKEILSPYYTTKKNGTGLGLSIVNKIINDHNGELNFSSILDGAKIEIYFRIDGN